MQIIQALFVIYHICVPKIIFRRLASIFLGWYFCMASARFYDFTCLHLSIAIEYVVGIINSHGRAVWLCHFGFYDGLCQVCLCHSLANQTESLWLVWRAFAPTNFIYSFSCHSNEKKNERVESQQSIIDFNCIHFIDVQNLALNYIKNKCAFNSK